MRRTRLGPTLVAASLTLATAAACGAVVPQLGADTASTHGTIDGLFGGVAARFTQPLRDPKLVRSRRIISRALLTPSRAFGDTAPWFAAPDSSTRLNRWHGAFDNGRYRFTPDTTGALPALPGGGRHDLRLRKLGDNVYEWFATTDYGIGATSPATIATIPVAWLAAAERIDTAAIRADILASFPRAVRAWGHVFSVSNIRVSRDASGAFTQRHVLTLHPDRAAHSYPGFAKWLRENVRPLRFRLRLHDSTRTWFDFSVRNDSLVVHARTIGGRLLPLEGGNAPLPDTATIEFDMTTRVPLFRAGFRAMRAEFVTVREPAARGWDLRFRRSPDWQLPLFAERMLRSPLRRPFQGEGVRFRIVATRDSTAPQTVLARLMQLTVEESALLRVLARITNAGFGSYADGADVDTNAWLAAAFGALRDDARFLVGSVRER